MSRRDNKPKGRGEDDALKSVYPHCGECEDENRSVVSASGTPRNQDRYKHLLEDRETNDGNKENESDDRRVLLAITVEIEDGCVEHIEMKEGDSAEAVATKFCRDHSLPDQFVAPLTEHIVSNIISISKEDKDIVFCSKGECTSFEENWPQNTPKDGSHMPTDKDYMDDSNYENKSSRSCACKFRSVEFPLSLSQKVNKSGSGRTPKLPRKGRQKTRRNMLSDRLLAPTLTSRAKMSGAEQKDQKGNRSNASTGPISDKRKAVYMRLYTEFLRQKQKLEEDKKRNLELYQDKIERDKTCISKKSWRIMRIRGRTAKQYRNYGELLYTEGLTKIENQQKMIVKKQKDDEARELAELTLKPEISKRAKQLRPENGQVWKRLQIQDKPKQDQLQELRNEIWEAKLMECTFKPQINPGKMHDGREERHDGSYSRFDQLFLDAESRRQRQVEYMQWYPEGVTFRPAINRRQNGLEMDGEYQHEGSVVDRLLHYASKLAEKKQMQELLVHRPIDPATGRQLFRPLTGRKPLTERNPLTLPIGDFLYKMRCTIDCKKEGLAEREWKRQKEKANCHYVGPTSQKLLGRIRQRGFKQLFDSLDEDKDGLVELATADLQRLSKDVVQDISEVIKMEDAEKILSFEKFVDIMLAVQNKTHQGTQVHLVLNHKTHSNDSQYTYQFKMDRLSRNLAIQRRKFNSSRQWYKLICLDRDKREQKVEAMRQEIQNKEMAECTFKPELYGRGGKGSNKGGSGTSGRSGEASSQSTTVEKEQQEVQGFYFRPGPLMQLAFSSLGASVSRWLDCPL